MTSYVKGEALIKSWPKGMLLKKCFRLWVIANRPQHQANLLSNLLIILAIKHQIINMLPFLITFRLAR